MITNVLILLACGILAGVPAALLVLGTAKRTEAPTPREEKLREDNAELAAENDRLQREIWRLEGEVRSAQEANRYLMAKFYPSLGKREPAENQTRSEMFDRLFAGVPTRRPAK